MSTTGHEEEFRRLFAQESTALLGHLSKELLILEETGGDVDVIASIFRDAHTLKGAASVVGLDDVARVAHSVEDLLEGIRNGSRPVTSSLIDAILGAVDRLSVFIPAVLSGSAEAGDADRVIESLAADVEAATAVSPKTVPPAPSATVPRARRPEQETHGRRQLAGAAERPVQRLGRDERHQRQERPDDDETVVVPAARLDDLVRLVGESAAAHLRVGRILTDRLGVDAAAVTEYRDLSLVLNELQERTMRTRMVPVSTITDSLHRGVRDLAKLLGKRVRWEVRGGDTELDRGMLQQLAQPLLHLVRNAVDHGVEGPAERLAAGKPEQASVVLHAMQLGSEVIVTVADDGRGIDVGRVREQAQARGEDVAGLTDNEALFLVFRSGLSTAEVTTSVSGRGIGLDVVRSNVADIRGRIEVRSELGSGSEFRIIVPITLAVLPCLLVASGAESYAIPMHSVLTVKTAAAVLSAHVEGRSAIWLDGEPVVVSSLATTLGEAVGDNDGAQQIVVVAASTRRHAFVVDALLGQRDVVVKGLSQLLPRLDVLAGASVEPDGSILLVLDALGTIDRARLARGLNQADAVSGTVAGTVTESAVLPQQRGSVLVVDDALTVRELERSILERAGFQVTTASDGQEALARLAEATVDLVLTDIEMPVLDGFALTEAIRANPLHANLPVLILTSLGSDQDRQRGLDAGADGYVVKSDFDETSLLGAIDALLGHAPLGNAP